jgi:hypothetical protein
MDELDSVWGLASAPGVYVKLLDLAKAMAPMGEPIEESRNALEASPRRVTGTLGDGTLWRTGPQRAQNVPVGVCP